MNFFSIYFILLLVTLQILKVMFILRSLINREIPNTNTSTHPLTKVSEKPVLNYFVELLLSSALSSLIFVVVRFIELAFKIEKYTWLLALDDHLLEDRVNINKDLM